jgi:cytoplasmic iron level regulating protein YaaA (DUF328/UPF0246 family)
MLILLSPAKRLNEANPIAFSKENTPFFLEEAQKVNAALKKLSVKKLMAMQDVSKAIAEQNWQRNQQWQSEPGGMSFYTAVTLFNGDAYQGLEAQTLQPTDLEFAQNHLRILSGLYGLLKPLDHIETYRLEMGTPLKIGRRANLYEYWRTAITKQIVSEFGQTPIVNLASGEYSHAIDFKKLKNPVLNVAFKDRNAQGQYKVMSYYAKRARGLMARYIIQKKLENPADLVHFQAERYQYAVAESSPTNLVFLRDH